MIKIRKLIFSLGPHWFRPIPEDQLNAEDKFPFRFECVLCGKQSLGEEKSS